MSKHFSNGREHTDAGFVRLTLRIAFALPVLFVLSVAARAGEDAADEAKMILKKTEDLYKSAKTYHGTLTLREAGKDRKGAEFSFTTTQELWYAAPNRLLLKITSEGDGSAQKTPHLNLIKASDGKTLTVYDGTRSHYYQRPALSATDVYRIFERAMPHADAPGLTLLAPVIIKGRPAYLVQTALKTPAPPASGPNGEQARTRELLQNALPPRFAVDKQNYQLLQVTSRAGAVTQTITLENQTLDSPLPADALTFTPPPGAAQTAPPHAAKP